MSGVLDATKVRFHRQRLSDEADAVGRDTVTAIFRTPELDRDVDVLEGIPAEEDAEWVDDDSGLDAAVTHGAAESSLAEFRAEFIRAPFAQRAVLPESKNEGRLA